MNMKELNKNRVRLLVISRDPAVRNNLVTLLTGYGYYVDYVASREEGIIKYRQHKQAVVIIDVPALPRFPRQMFRTFQTYRKNPIILIAAHPDEERRVYPYLSQGVFDIIELPLKVDYLGFLLRRLVEFNTVDAQNEFMRILIVLTVLVIPIWILLIYFLSVRGGV